MHSLIISIQELTTVVICDQLMCILRRLQTVCVKALIVPSLEIQEQSQKHISKCIISI